MNFNMCSESQKNWPGLKESIMNFEMYTTGWVRKKGRLEKKLTPDKTKKNMTGSKESSFPTHLQAHRYYPFHTTLPEFEPNHPAPTPPP